MAPKRRCAMPPKRIFIALTLLKRRASRNRQCEAYLGRADLPPIGRGGRADWRQESVTEWWETYYITKETYYITKETYYMTKEWEHHIDGTGNWQRRLDGSQVTSGSITLLQHVQSSEEI